MSGKIGDVRDIIEKIEANPQSTLNIRFQPIIDRHKKVIASEILTKININNNSNNTQCKKLICELQNSGNLRQLQSLQLLILKQGLEVSPTRQVWFNLDPNCYQCETCIDEIIEISNHYRAKKNIRVSAEITEYCPTPPNYQVLSKMVDKLQKHKIKAVIDDFGTEHNNILLLAEANWSALKINGALISKIKPDNTSPKVEDIIKWTIEIAKRMKIKVVGEWVEQEYQFEILKSWNCQYFQGFWCDRQANPIPQKIQSKLMQF